MVERTVALLLTVLLLAGCFNGGNQAINLGDVSIGQQLIDLQRALDEGVISEQEFVDTKQRLLRLNAACEDS